MTIFTYFHPQLGIVFIRANSRAEADAAGMRGLGSNLDYRDSGATVVSGKAAAGSRMYDARDGNLYFQGTTSGQDSPEMTSYFIGGPPTAWIDRVPDADAGDGGDGAGPIIGTEDFGDLYPSFQAGLAERGIGIGPGGGVRGQLADAAFRNLQSRGLLNLALNTPSGAIDTSEWADPDAPTPAELQAAAGPSFQEFARTRGLYGGAGAADALGLFNKALDYSAGRLPGFDTDDEGELKSRFDAPGSAVTYRGSGQLPNLISGAFLNPTQQGATDLARVAREAGRSRFGFASRFMPSAQQLSSSYFAQPQEGAMNFADFLNRRIFGV